MQVFRMEQDANRYCSYGVPDWEPLEFESIALFEGYSILDAWTPPARLAVVRGLKGDFVGFSPPGFSQIACNRRALEVIRPFVAEACELLPFQVGKETYWSLYIPYPTDCLDEENTEYNTEHRVAYNIRKAAFHADKLPKKHIFRIPGSFGYFVTDAFQRFVEEAGLTGLRFQLMWTDDPSKPDSSEAIRVPAARPDLPIVQGRRTKRQELLETLWTEVIYRRRSREWLDQELQAAAQADPADCPLLHFAGRALKQAIDQGLSTEALLQLASGLAYSVVFDTLVELDEAGVLRKPAYSGLHEDLLMADPRGPH